MPKFNIPVILVIFLLLLTAQNGRAQDTYQLLTQNIDALAKRGLPKSALSEVARLDALARKNNNTPQIIRAALYRIKYLAYIEENALLTIIDTLRADVKRSTYPVQPVLRSLLANTYWRYYGQQRWQISERTRLERPDPDITRWDVQTLITATNNMYRASLQDVQRLQGTPISVLDGVLVGDTSTRRLRPTLYDLLLHNALEFYLSEETMLPKPRDKFTLNDERLFADSHTFAAYIITTPDTANILYQGMLYLQQATKFHLYKNGPGTLTEKRMKDNSGALTDIDLKRLSLVHTRSTMPQKDSLYLAALQKLAKDQATNPLSAEVWQAIGNYHRAKDSLVDAHRAFNNAVKSFPNSIGGRNSAIAIAQIEEPSISATVEAVNLSNKPILALVRYKNMQQARVAIYKVSQRQMMHYKDLLDGARRQWSDLIPKQETGELITYLNTLPLVQGRTLTLPGSPDHRDHTAEFKIEPLPLGNYVLVIKRGNAIDTALTQMTSFAVSDLAYIARINPDGIAELRVMHRNTGKPLPGLKVQLMYSTSQYDQVMARTKYVDRTISFTTDNAGAVNTGLDHSQFEVALFNGLDTLVQSTNYMYGAKGDEDDDEDPENKTVLFTDRQIYRPGQTIYFKGLQMATLRGNSKVTVGEEISVDFQDANYRSLGKQQFKTNEFGTFAGTFIIPQNILNGQFTLKADDGQISVKVEEYKRPTFKVQIDPVKETYRFTDSVKVKGKIIAFSGYGLSQARVAYKVRRVSNQVRFTGKGLSNNRYVYEPPVQVATDTVMADDQGNYTIVFKSLPGDPRRGAIVTHRYEITADVTDARGETRLGSATVTLGTRDIDLQAKVQGIQMAKDPLNIVAGLTTLNNQPLKGTIKVQVYALQHPGSYYVNRLWQVPQYHLLSRDEHEKAFPEIAFTDQDQYTHWPTAANVATTEVQANTTAPGQYTDVRLDQLRQQPSGIYQVLISAKADNGDTISVKRYLSLVNKQGDPPAVAGWIMPLKTVVDKGGEAEFLVGIGDRAHILAERYRGPKLLSSAWMELNEQRPVKVKLTPGDSEGNAVQYMMLYHNRFYSSYQPITVLHPEKKLNVKMVTFRDKLQPDQKEQWKLQVTGFKNDLQAAEMVASMYDASLDDITQPASWQTVLDRYKHQPQYFAWNVYNLSQQQATQPLYYTYRNYKYAYRNYEKLDLLGYNYYGGYNAAYRQHLSNLHSAGNTALKNDQALEQLYKTNAALVKGGYDISGKVLEGQDELPGVSVRIKGTSIGTTTNSKGMFKIRVPANGVLIFSYLGYLQQEISTTKAATLTIKLKADGKALNDVVVVGYGVQKKADITGSVATVVESNPNEIFTSVAGRAPGLRIDEPVGSSAVNTGRVTIRELTGRPGSNFQVQVRGSGSISADKQPLYVVDGVIRDSMDDINPALISSIEVLKDASATALYGSRGANGVVVITTTAKAGVKPIVMRKNFNETAFFYPQLRTDAKGEVTVDFTIPGSLTKWRFRAFAHTKDLSGGYVQQDVVTQKQLMISANTPRFLREGDTITIAARVANLANETLKGRVQLQLFNALTMQPVNLLINTAEAEQTFELDANTNKAVSFKMVIPSGLDALTYRLTALSDTYSDGEENTLPVLSNRTLVTESMPMMVRSGQNKRFRFDKLVDNKSTTLINKTLTLEYTQNPAWYAVQSLPYLMEFPYECAEQIFSRYFANGVSAAIVNANPVIKTVFDRWKATNSKALLSNLEKNPELKATLLEETPWLRDAMSEQEQKKRIALLYDLNKLASEQQNTLEKLLNKQLPNGAFAWFGGDHVDRYITQHIIAGIGQLHQLKVGEEAKKLHIISKNALSYLDAELINDDKKAAKLSSYKAHGLDVMEVHAWYARSYYDHVPVSGQLKTVQQLYLDRAAKQWVGQSIYEQAMIALTMQRYGRIGAAKDIIRSLIETAKQSADNGMYWAKNHLGWFWYRSPVETQALMIELFTEAGGQAKAVEEMKIWLLRNKQTTNWRSTKATAAACYALLMKGNYMLGTDKNTGIVLDGKTLEQLKPDLEAEAGTGYIKTSWVEDQIKPALGKVEVRNTGNTISWGAMHWQYTEQMDKVTSSSTDITLERKYFIEKMDASGPVLTAVNATHQPKVGDVLKVVVYLKAGRDYDYIHLKDMRPAGTEPVDALSTFKYQDGLYYYQVTKDVATNFFMSRLNKGNYVFEYKLRVAQPGNFSTGISSVQSMYAPEFNAHSEGSRIRLVK